MRKKELLNERQEFVELIELLVCENLELKEQLKKSLAKQKSTLNAYKKATGTDLDSTTVTKRKPTARTTKKVQGNE